MLYGKIRKTGEPVEIRRIIRRPGCFIIIETIWHKFYERRDIIPISKEEAHRLDDIMAMRNVS